MTTELQMRLDKWIEQEIAKVSRPGQSCGLCHHQKVCGVAASFEKAIEGLGQAQHRWGGLWCDDILADQPTLHPIRVVEATVFRSVAQHCPFYHEAP